MLPPDSPRADTGVNPDPDPDRPLPGAADARGAAAAGGARGLLRRGLEPLRALRRGLKPLRALRPARPGPDGRSADTAGLVLARLTTLPALLIIAWLIPGLPLLLAGAFLPVPMLLISVPLAAAVVANGLRVVPARWPRLLPGDRTAEPRWATWFGLLATIAVVAGLTGWQLTESSPALIVLRDPGTYLQTGYWIAQHGSLPVPAGLAAFGGAHPGLSFASTGFLARGTSLYPAVQPGLPMLLAGGFWVHGLTGATAVGPVLGGLATLSFAGLAARLVGPQWAPAAALALGLSLPQQYIGRTSLSETALQILLFGGLCLLADSAMAGEWIAASRRGLALTPPSLLAAAAGLALGLEPAGQPRRARLPAAGHPVRLRPGDRPPAAGDPVPGRKCAWGWVTGCSAAICLTGRSWTRSARPPPWPGWSRSGWSPWAWSRSSSPGSAGCARRLPGCWPAGRCAGCRRRGRSSRWPC